MDYSIDNWRIVISGFMQDESRPNGILKLWAKLLKDRESMPNTAVLCHTWKHDFRAVAEMIWRMSPENGSKQTRQADIVIVGYSWGGWSAVMLARELRKRGMAVRHLILADAVYRHWHWLGRWRAFADWMKITVPPNVAEVTWFHQVTNHPRGHTVVAEDPVRTKVNPGSLVIDKTHQYIDDDLSFHMTTRDICSKRG